MEKFLDHVPRLKHCDSIFDVVAQMSIVAVSQHGGIHKHNLA